MRKLTLLGGDSNSSLWWWIVAGIIVVVVVALVLVINTKSGAAPAPALPSPGSTPPPRAHAGPQPSRVVSSETLKKRIRLQDSNEGASDLTTIIVNYIANQGQTLNSGATMIPYSFAGVSAVNPANYFTLPAGVWHVGISGTFGINIYCNAPSGVLTFQSSVNSVIVPYFGTTVPTPSMNASVFFACSQVVSFADATNVGIGQAVPFGQLYMNGGSATMVCTYLGATQFLLTDGTPFLSPTAPPGPPYPPPPAESSDLTTIIVKYNTNIDKSGDPLTSGVPMIPVSKTGTAATSPNYYFTLPAGVWHVGISGTLGLNIFCDAPCGVFTFQACVNSVIVPYFSATVPTQRVNDSVYFASSQVVSFADATNVGIGQAIPYGQLYGSGSATMVCTYLGATQYPLTDGTPFLSPTAPPGPPAPNPLPPTPGSLPYYGSGNHQLAGGTTASMAPDTVAITNVGISSNLQVFLAWDGTYTRMFRVDGQSRYAFGNVTSTFDGTAWDTYLTPGILNGVRGHFSIY
jgi:hypothetical protein